MKKSTVMYRVAFSIGLILIPFIVIADIRNLWWLIPIFIGMLVMYSITFYAMRLEDHEK